jgi:cytochrome c-type biogenesis protein CcmH/NrfG
MRASRFASTFGLCLLLGLSVNAQSTTSSCDPSLSLSKMEHMPPKGRLQDSGSLQATRIIKLNTNAIPLLIACLSESLRLAPNHVLSYSNLGAAYMNVNRIDEAEVVYKQAKERKLEGEGLLANR